MDFDRIKNSIQRSADLVKAWGKADLGNGRTLSDMLTFDGISLWNVIAVDFALYRLAPVILSENSNSSCVHEFRTVLCKTKKMLFDYLTIRRNSLACFAWPKGKSVLFLGFSAYMYEGVLRPVATSIASSDNITAVILHDWRRDRMEDSGQIKFQSIWNHWNEKIARQANIIKHLYEKNVDELLSTSMLYDMIRGHSDLKQRQIEILFKWLFRDSLPGLLPQLAIADHVIADHKPSLIVSPDVADARTRMFNALGKRNNIPSLEIQFGMYGGDGVEWQFFIADRLVVWGEKSRSVMLEHNVPNDRISITGSPQHDCMVIKSNEGTARTRRRWNIPAQNVMVLFVSMYLCVYGKTDDPKLLASVKKKIFNASKHVKGLSLIVKPHPNENASETRRFARGCDNVIFTDSNDDIKELVKASDAVVTLGSTVTMDALIANKLTICPVFPGWIWCKSFEESGSVLMPRSEEEMVKIFERIVANDDKLLESLQVARESFLKGHIHMNDGKASERIKDIAVKLISGKLL